MNPLPTTSSVPAAPRRPHVWIVLALACALGVAACGDRKGKGASQVAAKVNKEEISVHQINFLLQQQRGLKPEQAEAAGRQVLERLIDQELAVQRAQDMKLDRDPRVVQQIEASRREIVSRAYLEKVSEAAPRPSAEEVRKYYEDMPSLFHDRRIYSIQEVAVEARPDQIPTLRTQLQGSKTVNDFIEYLKANNFRFVGNQAVRPAEQLPLTLVEAFSKLKDGQSMLVPNATGAQVYVVAASRTEPIDEVRARPAIEQFLVNDAKRKLAEAELKSMRSTASIEYVGKFAEPAASAPPASGTDAAAQVEAAPQPVQAAAPAASSGIDPKAIDKGLSGLK
jgi:EpsD family peptidyl-prolyl cis-trans isomerase